MSTININRAIPKSISTKDDLDFDFLRKEGIRYIEQFGSKLWTDYNTHDPGITMLEVLCYAISDLGNRINLPIEDIVSRPGQEDYKGQFFTGPEILPSAPTTALDYRKLIIDLPEINNCWVKKEEITLYADLKQEKLSYSPDDFGETHEDFIKSFKIKGLYRFLVEPREETESLSDEIRQKIFRQFHAHRNLCEDLVKVEKVESFPVSVCANIEVAPEVDEELVHAKMIVALENYLSPSPRFYSLKEMTEKGYPTEKIFEGPLLQHGFLDDIELLNSELRAEVRLSDIINIIMQIEGVKVVKEITIGPCNDEDKEDHKNWIICVPKNKKPKLCKKTTLNYFKGVLPVNINSSRVDQYKKELLADQEEKEALAMKDREPDLPKGKSGKWGNFDSVQHDFPETYGLSDKGLPPHLGNARLAKAKQLKAYLLFFDQILASYFKHLDKVKDLLALEDHPNRTYFTQAINDIKGIDQLVENYPDQEKLLTDQLLGFLDNSVSRKNQILDHLIARFAEQFGNYAFLMKLLYGESTPGIVLDHKQEFLREYPQISRERGEGFNYYEQEKENLWDTDNVSGFQKRIARLSGIKNYNRRNLSKNFVEIYRYENVGGKWVYRWRIRDKENHIILSATESYASHSKAGNEMYFAILKILESSGEKLKSQLQKPFEDELTLDCFQFHKASTSDKYSFDVINPIITSASDSDRIIAKQYKYYDDQKAAIQAALDLHTFLRKDFTEEGIYLIEHILTLPFSTDNANNKIWEDEGKTFEKGNFLPFCSDDFDTCKNLDPYSFRVSVVLPGFTYRFANKEFRNYMENLIREELPSHIVAKICWIGYREGEEPEISQQDVENPEEPIFKENQLVAFEEAYKAFLMEKTDVHKKIHLPISMNKYNEILNEFVDSMTGLHTIYPTGRLYDCEDEIEELDGKLILGKTNLGTL
ncbi:hypothetical protein QWY93_15955 [Echinicola jeungdonensis]|uniref:Uncharacterized protein n=1 Tax=Echinicola jeungdonensis TaxID=709343 RepID=A0ABV5J8V0_9BACT|nr:hypothetical protein [Echinicola jeungdonensis]MDN3670815.1 hypothetical protein [Echinicola jeungdonensis]